MEKERRGMIVGSGSPLRRRTGGSVEGGAFYSSPNREYSRSTFQVESTSRVVKDSMASLGTVTSTSQIAGDAPLPWPVPKSELSSDITWTVLAKFFIKASSSA